MFVDDPFSGDRVFIQQWLDYFASNDGFGHNLGCIAALDACIEDFLWQDSDDRSKLAETTAAGNL